MSGGPDASSRLPGSLLLGSGILLLACVVLYNEFLAARLDPTPPLGRDVIDGIRSGQLYFLGTGLVLIVLGRIVQGSAWGGSLFRAPLASSLLLALLATFLPIYVAEVALRPMADFGDPRRKTTIFMRDPDLGWRMRPHAVDVWDGHPVRINGKGLRGPELDYAKPGSVKRVLFLGDSVTFGDGLSSSEEAFPHLTQTRLETHLGETIQAINSGVSGYSPWQEFIYLSREGVKYAPDLVVVGFVLNDVTEKFELVRFGGRNEGWQLDHTYSSFLDRLADKSAIVYFAKKLAAVIRFGRNVREGARRMEALDVRALIEHPDREDVRAAWQETFQELDGIWEFCRERRLPVMLVVFPFQMQLADPTGSAAPQRILGEHARARGVPMLDMLKVLADDMSRRGLKGNDYFLDSNHFSPFGNQVVADTLAGFIEKEGLLAPASWYGLGR